MKRLDVPESPCGELSKELVSIKARIARIEAPRKEGSDITLIKDINYLQNGAGSNKPYGNNYRPSQKGGNFNSYNGNRPHLNLSYANNNTSIKSPVGFNIRKGGTVEPLTNEEKYESGIQKILAVLREDRKNTEAMIEAVEGRINKLEDGLNIVASTVFNIKTQMDQVQKKAEEEKAKATARVAEINKK